MLERYARGISFHTSRADAQRYPPAVIALIDTGVFNPATIPITRLAQKQAPSAWLEPAIKQFVVR